MLRSGGWAWLFSFDFLPVLGKSLLVFVVTGLVVAAVLDGIGQVLLGGPVVGKIMRVEVMLAFDLGIGTVVVLVLQLARDGTGAACLHIGHGGVDGIVGRV